MKRRRHNFRIECLYSRRKSRAFQNQSSDSTASPSSSSSDSESYAFNELPRCSTPKKHSTNVKVSELFKEYNFEDIYQKLDESETNSSALQLSNSSSSSSSKVIDETLISRFSEITVVEFLSTLNEMACKHSLSNESVKDILSLVKSCLPSENNCPSYYSFRKISNVNLLSKSNFFSSDDIEYCVLEVNALLKEIVSRNFNQLILHHYIFNSKGEREYNLKLSLNTDGIRVLKSRRNSLWPVWIQILDLPSVLRFSYCNTVLVAASFGMKKPDWTLLLPKVVGSLLNLKEFGIELYIQNISYRFKFKVQMLVADLPARASILNMKQFNGKYGCTFCLSEGLVDNNRRIYPFEPYIKRTCEDYMQCIEYFDEHNEEKHGVKGITMISSLIEIPDNVTTDSMHSVFLGVCRQLVHCISDFEDYFEHD